MERVYEFNKDHKRIFDEAFDQAIEAKGTRQFCSCVWTLADNMNDNPEISNPSGVYWLSAGNYITDWVMNVMLKNEAYLKDYLERYKPKIKKKYWDNERDMMDIPSDVLAAYRVEWLTNVVKPAFYALLK